MSKSPKEVKQATLARYQGELGKMIASGAYPAVVLDAGTSLERTVEHHEVGRMRALIADLHKA